MGNQQSQKSSDPSALSQDQTQVDNRVHTTSSNDSGRPKELGLNVQLQSGESRPISTEVAEPSPDALVSSSATTPTFAKPPGDTFSPSSQSENKISSTRMQSQEAQNVSDQSQPAEVSSRSKALQFVPRSVVLTMERSAVFDEAGNSGDGASDGKVPQSEIQQSVEHEAQADLQIKRELADEETLKGLPEHINPPSPIITKPNMQDEAIEIASQEDSGTRRNSRVGSLTPSEEVDPPVTPHRRGTPGPHDSLEQPEVPTSKPASPRFAGHNSLFLSDSPPLPNPASPQPLRSRDPSMAVSSALQFGPSLGDALPDMRRQLGTLAIVHTQENLLTYLMRSDYDVNRAVALFKQEQEAYDEGLLEDPLDTFADFHESQRISQMRRQLESEGSELSDEQIRSYLARADHHVDTAIELFHSESDSGPMQGIQLSVEPKPDKSVSTSKAGKRKLFFQRFLQGAKTSTSDDSNGSSSSRIQKMKDAGVRLLGKPSSKRQRVEPVTSQKSQVANPGLEAIKSVPATISGSGIESIPITPLFPIANSSPHARDNSPEINILDDRDLYQSRSRLSRAFGFASEEAFEQWCRSPLFKSHYDTLMSCTKRSGRRSEGFSKVEAALMEGMRNGKAKYYHSATKDNFTGLDHKAFFIEQVRLDNEMQAAGIFYNSSLSDREKNYLIWQTYQRLQWNSSSSRPGAAPPGAIPSLASEVSREPEPGSSSHYSGPKLGTANTSAPEGDEQMSLVDTVRDSLQQRLAAHPIQVDLSDRAPLEQTDQYDLNDSFWKYHLIRFATLPYGEETWELVRGALCNRETLETALEDESVGWAAHLAQYENTDKPLINIPQPTAEDIQKGRKLEDFFNNTAFQREDYDASCTALGIRNPNRPQMSGHLPTWFFKVHQPPAIKAILDCETATPQKPSFGGCLLSDLTGLGKTSIAIGWLLFHHNRRFQIPSIPERIQKYGPPRPILVLVPTICIQQFIEELEQITQVFIVEKYHGDIRSGSSKTKLTKAHSWFSDTNEDNARRLIVSTPQTIAKRHGPEAQKRWMTGQKFDKKVIHGYAEDGELHDDFPASLEGCFSRAVIDECQSIKTKDTDTACALEWLDSPFWLLMSATPFPNSILDFEGYIPFVHASPTDEHLEQISQAGITLETNVFALPRPHRFEWTQVNDAAYDKFIKGKSIAVNVKTERLRQVLSQIMIRRTYASRIPFDIGKPIGSLVPDVHTVTIHCPFTEEEEEIYRAWYTQEFQKLVRSNPRSNRPALWDWGTYRRLVLGTNSLMFTVNKTSSDTNVSKLKAAVPKADLDWKWVRDFKKANPNASVSLPEKEENSLVLRASMFGAPKKRALIRNVAEQVLVRGEKALIFCAYPATQVELGKAFNRLKMDAVMLLNHLTPKEKDEIRKRFTQNRQTDKILICTFGTVNGISLHHHCRNVHFYDEPPNQGIYIQDLGRVRRIGSIGVIMASFYRTPDSFSDYQLQNFIKKTIPTLFLEVSNSLLSGGDHPEDGSIDFPSMFKLPNGELVPVDDDRANAVEGAMFMTADEWMADLLLQTRGRRWDAQENGEFSYCDHVYTF